MDRKLPKVDGRKTSKRLFYIGSAYLRMGIDHRPLSRSRHKHLNNNDHFTPLPFTSLTPSRSLEEEDKVKLANSGDTGIIKVTKIMTSLQNAVVSRDNIEVVVDYRDDMNITDNKTIKKSKDNDDIIMNDAEFIDKDDTNNTNNIPNDKKDDDNTIGMVDVSNSQISKDHIDASMEIDIVTNNSKKKGKNVVQISHYYKTRKSSRNSKNFNNSNVQQKIEANKDDKIGNSNYYMNSSIYESRIGKKEVFVEEKSEINHQDDEELTQNEHQGQEAQKEHGKIEQKQKEDGKGETVTNRGGEIVTGEVSRYGLRPRKKAETKIQTTG
ncbi:345_t:CDS:2 [Ambispora leptoticha]|uniref:345_t:CDS:1 n=1 Tax=Ambispora leptoticha TaxID=144679 RepID=A0A9N8ZX80_9GLOM|nr:345_t:CDS:2 [Ambispora leptoticha]